MPIWTGFKDRKGKTPSEMVNEFLGLLVKIMDYMNEGRL